MSETTFVFVTVSCAVFAVLIVWILCSSYLDRKHREAVEYLLWAIEKTKIYFHGYPVAKCMKEGVVWKLRWHEVGDFARQFGGLVLYALHMRGDSSARIYWRDCWDEATRHEYYAVYVSFKYGRRNWLYDVQNPDFGKNSVQRAKKSREFEMEFTEREYWDLDRGERYLFENCTDPTRSMLTPDFCYSNTEDLYGHEEMIQNTLQIVMRE